MSITRMDRTVWSSRELSRLERSHWQRESGEASREDETAQGKCEKYEEKGQNPAGPNTDGAEREQAACLLRSQQTRGELSDQNQRREGPRSPRSRRSGGQHQRAVKGRQCPPLGSWLGPRAPIYQKSKTASFLIASP